MYCPFFFNLDKHPAFFMEPVCLAKRSLFVRTNLGRICVSFFVRQVVGGQTLTLHLWKDSRIVWSLTRVDVVRRVPCRGADVTG